MRLAPRSRLAVVVSLGCALAATALGQETAPQTPQDAAPIAPGGPPVAPPLPPGGGRRLPPLGADRTAPVEVISETGTALVIDGERVPREEYGEALIEEYGASFVEPFVANHLLERRAKELKVEVPEAEVAAAADRVRKDLLEKRYGGDEAKLRAALAQSGMTLETWLSVRRRALRKDLLAKAVVRADRDLSEAALRNEFEARYGKGGVKRTGTVIFISTQVWTSGLYTQADFDADRVAIDAEASKRAQAARLELAKGKDFAELARERSDDPMAQKGGDYGRHWRNRLGAEADQRLSQLKPGETSEVLMTPTGAVVARATGIHEGWELRARQILLSTRVAGAGEAALRERKTQAALSEAATLTAAIKAGTASFEETARARSDHARSKEKGGDLGSFMSGTLAPELEAALTALEDGGLSHPIVTPEGVHILQLISKKRRPDLDMPLISIMRFSTEFLKVKERRLAGVIEEKARDAAEDVKRRLEAGEDAAALARARSEDLASKEQGGAISEPLKPGTPPEVEAAFRALTKAGEVALVKAERGYHVIKLETLEATDFAAKRAELEKEQREREPSPLELREYRDALRRKAKVQRGPM